MPGYTFSEIRDRLDDWRLFNNMVDSPYYSDAVYERFSTGEYERRYNALRAKMRERGLDCVIVPGGPNHWSFAAGCSGSPATRSGTVWPTMSFFPITEGEPECVDGYPRELTVVR